MNNYDNKIIHISDPHFGTEDQVIAKKLIAEINSAKPDVVVVSGDLTQRALKREFWEAKKFLDNIEFPKVVIPGNHDIPVYNFIQRFINPYKKYRAYISEERYPKFISEKSTIVGVNTCTPFRSRTGRIKDYDIEYLQEYFSKIDSQKLKGVVIHHNIFPFIGMKRNTALVNADIFLPAMNECGVDLVFAGHLHKSLVHTFNEAEVNNNLLVLQAGTAISRRQRKEENTYLVIGSKNDEINVEFRVYDNKKFELVKESKYRRYLNESPK